MKTIVKIDFNGKHSPGGPEPLLRRAGCGPDVATINIEPVLDEISAVVKLELTDDRVSGLVNLLLRHGIRWWESREDVYSEKEYERARLVVVEPDGHREIFGGQRLGTKYTLDHACKACGAGAKQTSPLMIDDKHVPELKKVRAISTYFHDIMVDDRLAEELESLNVKGLSFRDVYAVKKKGGRQTKLPWKQLCAARSLPPMSEVTTGLRNHRPCLSCKRSAYVGYWSEPLRLAYTLNGIADIDEVMTTWEWHGTPWPHADMGEAQFPYPLVLVSPRVMRVLQAAEPKMFQFWPIRIFPYDP